MSNEFQGEIKPYYDDSKPWWPEPKRPPEGAPNVVYIVLDDTGYSHLGCYGSDISTPNIDKLANGGLRYTNFHTTAICSPTRTCLLTGRNHHSAGMGFLADIDNGFPNSRGRVSKETALLSEILQEEGYSTLAVGKWHLLPSEERSLAGPFDHWPLSRGFERYYGFLGGETNQWNPDLVSGNEYIDQPKQPEEGYHLTEDLTDKAIQYVREQKSAAPDKPFFLYLAYGATHAPHHAPKEFIDKYAGKYDQGWDVAREQWFSRQKKLGIIPQNAQLPPRNPGVKPWHSLTPTERQLFARMQEVFAGFLDHTDYHIGRFLDALREIGQFDNTIIVLVSDNGASPEGQQIGTWNEYKNFNGEAEQAEQEVAHIDKLGTPEAYNHYPIGWAQVGNTPLKWYKTFVHAGGVKDPFIISYPDKIKDAGGIRSQYHHAIDVVPTILELAEIQAPAELKGIQQKSIEGVSLAYSFEQPLEPSRRTTQYYEMLGNRAIYHEGWKAVTYHIPGTSFNDDKWELYHVDKDFSENNDLAQSEPEKLKELIQLWWKEAELYGVLPIDGRGILGKFSGGGQRPEAVTHKYYPGTEGYHHYVLFNPRLTHSIEADLVRTSADQEGAILASGGRFGGFAFYVQNNRLVYHYNFIGEQHYVIVSAEELPVGPVTVRFDYSAETQTGKLYVDQLFAGEGDILKVAYITGPGVFSVGKSAQTPVSDNYETPFIFSGELKEVRVTIPQYIRDQESLVAKELAVD
ncbi:arylsulfatase [Paenibacillus sp. Marseille-P2973]|uniref:arylsulfatase n=1 Tax=Paenibacillus sp. Marseille-P2973 TaxID=1871032 RepID=UPI001B390961|nr:arylsulfatase [Paenibacillus sp. Marseille-P2973]MBQ4900773.1 arylsulfatase [Paenibacillus sp. Marseille-P2973]